MIISVIIPTHNEYENLLKLQKFFFDQSCNYASLEVIIADSSDSTDNAHNLTAPFKYLKTTKSGRAAQMNAGAKICIGEILFFLHADVLPPVSFIEDVQLAISSGYEFGFFAYSFAPTTFFLNINASFTGKKGLFAGGGDQIHFMTKSLYHQMNGYDENFAIMEDFDFFQRYKRLYKPYIILQNKATVSSRKYFKNSWLKVNVVNLIVFTMFSIRLDSRLIKRVYLKLLK